MKTATKLETDSTMEHNLSMLVHYVAMSEQSQMAQDYARAQRYQDRANGVLATINAHMNDKYHTSVRTHIGTRRGPQ